MKLKNTEIEIITLDGNNIKYLKKKNKDLVIKK
jgi:hypothetical protein